MREMMVRVRGAVAGRLAAALSPALQAMTLHFFAGLAQRSCRFSTTRALQVQLSFFFGYLTIFIAAPSQRR